MLATWKRVATLVIVSGALLVWGCDTTTSPPPASEALAPAEGDPDLLLKRLTGTVLGSLMPVTRGAKAIADGVVSGVIAAGGGVLELGGHSLTVPAGAVEMPTLFSLTIVAGDVIEVELRAFDVATGQDVGAGGFLIPVRLALSYAEASVSDPSKLVVVRYEADGSKTELPTTVDQTRKVAWTDLEHFTRYGLCES